MIEKIAKNIAMAALSKKISKTKNKQKNTTPQVLETHVEVINVMEFVQPGTFRGFKRYRLTIYGEPGVDEGISHFRNIDTNGDTCFKVKHGTPIRLLIKNVTGYNPFMVIEVYADGHKVGVMYIHNQDNDELLNKPFDKVYIKIDYLEVIVHKNGIEHRPIVYLFVHYVD